MNFTFEDLDALRKEGYTDDQISSVLQQEDSSIGDVLKEGYTLEQITSVISGQPIPESFAKPIQDEGTSFAKEIGQLGPAFIESIGRPLESMGETAEALGMSGIASALKGAITEPENYESASSSFAEPKPGDSSFLGFAWQYAPRAAVEQAGQLVGSMATRAAGGLAGAPLGPAGIATGAFLGPAIFEAAQIIGPVAKERAMNNGREVPNGQDLAVGTLTALGSGALNAIGAKYLPGGEEATGKFFKRVATGFLGEAPTEFGQSIVEQAGGTAFTEKGTQINLKQAAAEGIIGGTSGSAINAVLYPFTPDKPQDRKIVTQEEAAELDIEGKSNAEAINLTTPVGDVETKQNLSKIKELESYKASNDVLLSALEPNEPEAQQINLENAAIDKEISKLKGSVINAMGVPPVTSVEEEQVRLAREIGAPIEEAPVVEAPAPVVEAPAEVAPAQVSEPITPIAELPPAPVAEEVAPAIEEAAPVETVTPAPTTLIADQADPNAPARATEPAPPRPTKETGGKDWRAKKDAWDEQYGDMRNGGRTHNDDGSVYQPTFYDTTITEIINSGILQSSEGTFSALGVSSQLNMVDALKLLLNDGWQWDAEQRRMVNPANPSETPAQGYIRLTTTPTPAPVTEQATPAETPAPEVAPALERTTAGKQIIKQAEESGVNVAELNIIESAIQQIDNPQSSIIPEATTAEAIQYLQYTPEGTSVIDHLRNLSQLKDKRDAGIKKRATAILEKLIPTPAVSETITEPTQPTTLDRSQIGTATEESVETQRLRENIKSAKGVIQSQIIKLSIYDGSFVRSAIDAAEMGNSFPNKGKAQLDFENLPQTASIDRIKLPKLKKKSPEEAAQPLISDDDGRWVLGGVLFDPDKNVVVSTNGRAIVVLPTEVSGKRRIVAARNIKSQNIKKGDLIEENYPNWQKIIPRYGKNVPKTSLDIEEARKASTVLSLINKSFGLDHYKIMIGDAKLDPKYVLKSINALVESGATTITAQVKNGMEPVLFTGDNGAIAVVMPMQSVAENGYRLGEVTPVKPTQPKAKPVKKGVRKMAAVSEDISPVPQENQKQNLEEEATAPVLDPIGYGNALINLFPTLKSAGVKAISMEESLVRLEKQWEEKQKSGKATVLDKLVYLANKKNTENALAGDSVGGTWTRSDLTVAVSSKATPSAMSHEIGHAIMELEFANADQKTKDEIIAEYNKWFASTYGKDGVPSVADQRRIWEWMSESDWLDPKAPFPQEKRVASWEKYRSSFKEWFADEVAKWATTNVKPKSLIEKFFTELAAKLNKLWNAVSENFAPNKTLAMWLDSITSVSPSKVELAPKGDKIELLEATPEPSNAERITGKSQVAGIPGIGAEKDTPKGINAKTEEIIRKKVFSAAEVSDNNTKKAWTWIERLDSANPESFQNAQAVNEFTRETMQDVDTQEVVKQTIGAIKLKNELYTYAIKLAAQGKPAMLQQLLNTKLALGSGELVQGDPGRLLQAEQSLKNAIIMASEAEQEGFFTIAAQQFFDTSKPTKDQVQQIKDIFNRVKQTKIDQEKELMDEIEEVGKAAGVELPKIIEKELTNSPALDPMVLAIQNLQRTQGGTILTQYIPFSQKAKDIREGVQKVIKSGITNFRDSLVKTAASGLEVGFWKTMANTENKPGPLGELDSYMNRELAKIVKDTLVGLGLKGEPPNTKMGIIEQVASILNEASLSQDKAQAADKNIRTSIEAKRQAELEGANAEQEAAVNAKYDQILLAWDESMSRQLEMPISNTLLRRLLLAELREGNSSIAELADIMESDPTIGASRQDRLVNAVANKVAGVTFEGQPSRDYTTLTNYLSEVLDSMIQTKIEKNKAGKNANSVKRKASGSPESQAQSQIDKLAKVQADPTIFGEKQIDPVRTAVADALSLKLNIGFSAQETANIKRTWKGSYAADPNQKGLPTSFMLTMQRLGVKEETADVLANIVWNQIEANAMNRQMELVNKSVEFGPIGGMVQAILNTPLYEQQDPEWRKNVIKDYLKNAGVDPRRIDSIASLFDLSLRKRFAQAQEKAAEKAAKGIRGGLTPNSKRALEKFLKAIRAQVLDPSKDVAKAFGEQMGWKGFTPEQLVKLNELDAIFSDETRTDAERAATLEKINNLIDEVSAPVSVKDVLASFYVGNALMRFTTFAVQGFDPAAFATFNLAIDTLRNVTSPSQLWAAWSNYGQALANFVRETGFSFGNDTNRSGRMIDYLDNQDRASKKLWKQAGAKWNAGNYQGAFKDGLFGYTYLTFRTLKALDDGAYSLLVTSTLPRYVDMALKMAKVPKDKRLGVMRDIQQARQLDIKQMIADGVDKNDAVVYANERMMAAVTSELGKLNIPAQDVINSAINDALSRIGKTRFTEDIIDSDKKEIKDRGFLSAPLLKFYEGAASAAQKSGSESQKIFYRILFGFPLIPARIFNVAAGYTPLTLYRHLKPGRYELTYGTAIQRRQRLVEQLSGAAIMLPLLVLRSLSLDEEDEKEKGFGIYITGQGPRKSMDKETWAQWNKKFQPYSISYYQGGKRVASIDAKAAGPLAVMIYTLGAIDDWQIRRKQEGLKTGKRDWDDVEQKASVFQAMWELAGSFALTTARRSPTTGVMQGLVDFRRFPDDPLAAIAADASFSAMPAVPVLGAGVVKNLSDFFSEPMDRTTKEGAIYANMPIVGPLLGKPALNGYGQTLGELQFSEKLKKSFGVPFTLLKSQSPDDMKLMTLTFKFGNGPEFLRRQDVENALQSSLSDEEWYLAAKTYGEENRAYAIKDFDNLMKDDPKTFAKIMSNYARGSKEIAIQAVEKYRKR